MATNLPFCFFIQFLEQLLKFLVNFTLLKYVKSQRSYGFLITKKLIFGFQILDLKVHFSASLTTRRVFFSELIHFNVYKRKQSQSTFLRKKSIRLWGIFNNYKEKLSVPRVHTAALV